MRAGVQFDGKIRLARVETILEGGAYYNRIDKTRFE